VYNGTKHAFIGIGGMVGTTTAYDYVTDDMPHKWYSLAGVPCPHGHEPGGFAGTGQKSTTALGRMFFYDPDHVADSVAGARDPWSLIAEIKNLAEYDDFVMPDGIAMTSNWEWQSLAYEPETRLLFVPQTERLDAAGGYRPLIHVFQLP
jgi:hypothetical protein